MLCNYFHSSLDVLLLTTVLLLHFVLKQKKTIVSPASNMTKHQLSWDDFHSLKYCCSNWCTILQFHQALPSSWSWIFHLEYIQPLIKALLATNEVIYLVLTWKAFVVACFLEVPLISSQIIVCRNSIHPQPFLMFSHNFACYCRCCNNLQLQNLLTWHCTIHLEECNRMLCCHDIWVV